MRKNVSIDHKNTPNPPPDQLLNQGRGSGSVTLENVNRKKLEVEGSVRAKPSLIMSGEV